MGVAREADPIQIKPGMAVDVNPAVQIAGIRHIDVDTSSKAIGGRKRAIPVGECGSYVRNSDPHPCAECIDREKKAESRGDQTRGAKMASNNPPKGPQGRPP